MLLSLETVVLVGCDDHVAFGLAVVAHALHAVDLRQLVDDLPVLSVHRREAVAPLWLFSLQIQRDRWQNKANDKKAGHFFHVLASVNNNI